MEASHGRFYDMDGVQQGAVRRALDQVLLTWRHCPFGLHALAGPDRAPLYLTFLRDPYKRLKVRTDARWSWGGHHNPQSQCVKRVWCMTGWWGCAVPVVVGLLHLQEPHGLPAAARLYEAAQRYPAEAGHPEDVEHRIGQFLPAALRVDDEHRENGCRAGKSSGLPRQSCEMLCTSTTPVHSLPCPIATIRTSHNRHGSSSSVWMTITRRG
jgi:hypothetical protein